MKKSLLLAAGGAALNGSEYKSGADFDGVNDYFSRGGDLTGNADGKTISMSFWVYLTSATAGKVYVAGTTTRFTINFDDGRFSILGINPSASAVLNASFAVGNKPEYENTFLHFSISFDLSNPAKRHVYINDDDATSIISWDTYTNDNIEFTAADHSVGAIPNGSAKLKGRIAQLFLDYTYRDLSIEANRRLFTNYDPEKGLIPAPGQAALNPIIYMPMDDETELFVNQGTGGNFVQNGVIALSNRGAGQYNASASEFDGVSDYLNAGSIGGISDSKVFTASFHCKAELFSGHVFHIPAAGAFSILRNSNRIDFEGHNSGGSKILDAQILDIPTDSNVMVSISVDMSSPSKRHVVINGGDVTGSVVWNTYTDDVLDLTGLNNYIGALNGFSSFWKGSLGRFYLDTSYINLSNNNPFYDTDTNKPKYLGEQGELPTGSQPLVYLPLRADDAGNNPGSGGDFTVNSGPFTGARGPSEYWARSVVVDGLNYLTGSVFCQSLVKWISVDSGVTWTPTYANGVTVTDIGNGTDNGVVAYYYGTSENINWALEENKLRFTDAFGLPVPPKIDNNSVLFLDFSNLDNLGENKAGADFTVIGSPASGPDVNG